jgi:hypothetical protein
MRARGHAIQAPAHLNVAAQDKSIRWEHRIVANSYGHHHLTTRLKCSDKGQLGHFFKYKSSKFYRYIIINVPAISIHQLFQIYFWVH